MIKKIVTTYGGSISILSQEDQGACYCVVWPKINAAMEKDAGISVPLDKSERVAI